MDVAREFGVVWTGVLDERHVLVYIREEEMEVVAFPEHVRDLRRAT
jgi:hypothetical protein